jgi:hypothetical protein
VGFKTIVAILSLGVGYSCTPSSLICKQKKNTLFKEMDKVHFLGLFMTLEVVWIGGVE